MATFKHIFMQLRFSVNRVTDKSPVQYWFIKTKAWVVIQKMMAWLKPYEIRSELKIGSFNKGKAFWKGGQGSFCSELFYNDYKNLIELPKYTIPTFETPAKDKTIADKYL
jgi:hypothetical protein